MKNPTWFLLLILAFTITPFNHSSAQAFPTGAWKYSTGDTDVVMILHPGYLVNTSFSISSKSFYQTHGGIVTSEKNKFKVEVEFNTEYKTKVGEKQEYSFTMEGDKLIVTSNGITNTWTRIDANESDLAGVWQISARMQGDKMNPINRGARKTLKILSGKRFQWVAINTETKEYFGTGGGTYTFKDGKYTENIEFFSRDSSRVGASLVFDGSVTKNVWTHKGKNSRGEALHEEWSRD